MLNVQNCQTLCTLGMQMGVCRVFLCSLVTVFASCFGEGNCLDCSKGWIWKFVNRHFCVIFRFQRDQPFLQNACFLNFLATHKHTHRNKQILVHITLLYLSQLLTAGAITVALEIHLLTSSPWQFSNMPLRRISWSALLTLQNDSVTRTVMSVII